NGFVKTYYFTTSENHDYTDFDDACFGNDFDDSAWQNAVLAAPLETEYLQTNCPCDAEMQEIPFEFLGEKNGEKVYRCAKNISGYPVIRLHAKRGETVKIAFDETINPDFSFSNKEDPTHTFMQTMEIVADGQERIVRPQFTWFGFQYFKIKGEATPEKVVFVYSAVEETGKFSSDQKTLDWIYRAYVDSQLGNMHAGIPSDCPHFERRGYTGDGQLAAPAAMKTIGAEAFYRKWIEDISDSQDRISGHAQYVVPLHYGGGGPGGWGCAIVEVPYQYYKHYGDIAPFKKMYAQMLHWFDFMQNHSENGIVTSDIPGNWCLGEWVTPEPVTIPEGFVNTYFYIRSMQRCLELLPVIGATQDESALTERIEACKKAMNTAFFNAQTESYADGVQGADAFALDIGLGTEKTLQNLVERYTALGHFDTGIFGTEILPRVLFEKGYGNLALQLLITDHPTSFESWRKQGLTTLGENWPSSPFQRSYNHPMFGAVVSHFYTYLLGIRQKPTAGGYTEISIDPCFCEKLNTVSGSMMTANGKLTVSYKKQNGGVQVEIDLPSETKARLTVGEKTFALKNGKNSISAENY
ncbi:MAG: family 78 glycoside hydrolase catalytic domain, partial [Clostridia bacterium]|nr:family 78 glycoside hydrolase catalytic domain [Clostridia bacterium]